MNLIGLNYFDGKDTSNSYNDKKKAKKIKVNRMFWSNQTIEMNKTCGCK